MRISQWTVTVTAAAAAALGLGLWAQQSGNAPQLDAIHQLKNLEMTDSQVMTIESWLSDVYGPRLTNSPDM
ncbi:MAG: hypothetical protein ACRD1L_14425, partial [Terriglobales bacterium]